MAALERRLRGPSRRASGSRPGCRAGACPGPAASRATRAVRAIREVGIRSFATRRMVSGRGRRSRRCGGVGVGVGVAVGVRRRGRRRSASASAVGVGVAVAVGVLVASARRRVLLRRVARRARASLRSLLPPPKNVVRAAAARHGVAGEQLGRGEQRRDDRERDQPGRDAELPLARRSAAGGGARRRGASRVRGSSSSSSADGGASGSNGSSNGWSSTRRRALSCATARR